MARNYDLNKLRLEADEYGFTLHIPTESEVKPLVVGEFDTPELIVCYKLRNTVLEAYAHQEGVYRVEFVGSVDYGTDQAIHLETTFFLEPGINWFELDHTVFNEVYCG